MNKHFRKIISVLMTLTMLISVSPMIVSADTAQEYKVVWIGGSFTEGTAGVDGDRSKCFASLVTKWMNETEYAGKNVTVTGINSGVGGTMSPYGRMRYEKDVLAYNPDLVFIEYNGNDAEIGNYLQTAYAMESMVRRTMTASPKTKVVFLERPEWTAPDKAATAQKYHQLVADYYDVPLIDITNISENVPDGVLSDGSHPNEKGHAAIAEGIENWLTENAVNYPTMKLLPLNPSYTPIIPVYHDAKDYMVADQTSGWYVNCDGQLQSDKQGDVLTLKFKGDAFAFPGASGGTDAVGYYVIDSSINSDNREESGLQGSIFNQGHCKGYSLGLGTGEHIMKIKNNYSASSSSECKLVLDKIIVDGIENDNLTSVEPANYSVFYDKITDDQTFNWYTSKCTDGGGVVKNEGSFATMWLQKPSRGLAMQSKGSRLEYTIPEDIGAVGSVSFRVGANTKYSETNPLMNVYAIDKANKETKLTVLPGTVVKGLGNNTNPGWTTYDFEGCGIPSRTQKLAFEYLSVEYGVALSNVRYTYGASSFEKVTMELNPRTFVGSEEQVVVKGYNSDGSRYDLSNADIVYYTSDTDIVDVNSTTGVVKGKAVGIATVNAKVTVGDKTFEKSAKIEVYLNENITSSWFSIPKNTYIVGTSGKIDFHVIINDTEYVDKLKVKYVSDNTKVITIDDDGSFKAVGAGTAVITPTVGAINKKYSPITIKVAASNTRKHSFVDDNTSGKYTVANMRTPYSSYRDVKIGSELYAWTMGCDYNNVSITNGGFKIGEGAGTAKFAAFVYKLDNLSDKFEFDYINNHSWAADPSILYYSDEEYTFTNDQGVVYDFNDNNTLTSILTNGFIYSGRTDDGAIIVHDGWVEDKKANKTTLSASDYEYLLSSDIPDGAKYALVLFDYGTTKHPVQNTMIGAEITSKIEIAAVEPIGDNKLAVTFTGAVENPVITSFKVNGETVDAAIDSYDADTYTLYVSGVYEGGMVSITIDGIGTKEVTIDTVVDVKVTDEDGKEISSLTTGQTSVNVTADVKYSNDENVQLFAAYYNKGKLESVKKAAAVCQNGKATLNLNMVFDSESTEENKLKVFCWKENLKPITDAVELNTEIAKEILDALYGSQLDKGMFDVLKISEFYNNKKAAASVTFDDGILAAAEYYNSLFKKNNIHGTAMLVADWVREENIPKWQALFDEGNIDLGNHSKSHNINYNAASTTDEEIIEDITGGYNKLKEMFPNEEIITFASPWTQTNSLVASEVKKHHFANRCAGNGGFASSSPTEQTMLCLPSFVVQNTHTTEELNSKIDTAIANKQWFIYLLHGVGGTDTYDINREVCAEHFAYLGSKADDVWAGSLSEVVKYIYEKQNADVSCNWMRENAMSISVTDSLDDKIFNFPLTIKVNVPSGWNTVEVIQNGTSTTVIAGNEGDKNYVYINVIPDNGRILIKNK